MKILFLDDDEERHGIIAAAFDDVTRVFNVDEFKEALEHGPYDVVMLDHDLEDEHYEDFNAVHERTGLDAVKMLCVLDTEHRPPNVIVHSWNPVGARRMLEMLRDAGFAPIYAPFDYTIVDE